ncbi:fungal zn(2)-Cys(6) binuclear cluster domain-protein [Parachaetomium inaequale]|uniref:Fungal zn(2)-Cys(6) binuclear cluster domain-protein n=1 Tax=Parachaetomium inaequale TaxID=2588326 RepID=A0AAN6SM81_9PEZI|nr:fungal zn(2)-Cys(6) binuclear cluster domain-protein [Parachaetomium inaequale]
MVPATTVDGDTLQSVRSSCDRCRSYKLKCTVLAQSEGPLPCERCVRAKLPCVFGRRRRAARTAEANPKQQQQQQQRSATPSTAPALPTMRATPPSLTPPTPTPAPDTIPVGSTGAWGLPPPQGFFLGDLYVLDTNNVPAHSGQQQQSGGAMFAWDWPQHGFGLDDTCMLDTTDWSPTLLAMTPMSMQQQPTADDITTVAPISGDTKPGEDVGNSPGLGLWPLLALTAEMQQTLKMLDEGPWRLGGGDEGGENSLDNYPVGTVLHLLQKFGAVAGPVLSQAASAAEAMTVSLMVKECNSESGLAASDGGNNEGMRERGEAPHASERGSKDVEGAGTAGPTGDGPTVNTATVMLILGGYMWLSHICNTVLGHFHTYLSRLPPDANRPDIPGRVGGSGSGGGGATGSASTTSPTLKLGELPCFSAAHDLGKIHNALSMLLAAMGGVEEQLGAGGVVARNLVVSALVSHGAVDGTCGELEDGYRKLTQKVQSVKALLREKMGL